MPEAYIKSLMAEVAASEARRAEGERAERNAAAEIVRERLTALEKSAAGAPEREIELTPEMVSAGVAVLEEYLGSYYYPTLVEALYIAMRALERSALPFRFLPAGQSKSTVDDG